MHPSEVRNQKEMNICIPFLGILMHGMGLPTLRLSLPTSVNSKACLLGDERSCQVDSQHELTITEGLLHFADGKTESRALWKSHSDPDG